MAENDQYRNPQGEEGLEVIKKMNEHHRELTEWGLSMIPPKTAKMVLDIGCGGGNALKMLAMKYPNAKCHGIDISETCINATLDNNKMFHRLEKVFAQVASVENIPFSEGTFDVVSAVETYFFWPDLERNIAHIVSRMAANGILCIISEQYPTEANKVQLQKNCETYGMKIVSNEDIVAILEKNGLEVTMETDADKNWVTFIGIKA